MNENVPKRRPGIYYSEYFKGGWDSESSGSTYVTYLTRECELSCGDVPKYNPSLCISIEAGRKLVIPKKTAYYKAAEITEQSFDDFYKMNYRRLQDESLEDAEFYQNDKYDDITLYAIQGQKLFSIFAELIPTCRSLSVRMSSNPGRFRRRIHQYKKIEPEVFKQAYHLLLELFYDSDTVYDNFETAWGQLDALVHGDQPIHGIKINADVYFDNMIRAIRTRARRLEKKLIDEDGTPEERARLRGELKGMEYCLKVINEHR